MKKVNLSINKALIKFYNGKIILKELKKVIKNESE